MMARRRLPIASPSKLCKLSKRSDQVAPDAAAHAAIVHCDQVFRGVHGLSHKASVDRDFSKLILQHRYFPFVLLLEDVVDKGGLPCSQETCDDSDGGFNIVLRLNEKTFVRAFVACVHTRGLI